ncbi:hypothetical protein D3C76_1430680 [compost metagenome]
MTLLSGSLKLGVLHHCHSNCVPVIPLRGQRSTGGVIAVLVERVEASITSAGETPVTSSLTAAQPFHAGDKPIQRRDVQFLPTFPLLRHEAAVGHGKATNPHAVFAVRDSEPIPVGYRISSSCQPLKVGQ